jgi:hypothetical protein
MTPPVSFLLRILIPQGLVALARGLTMTAVWVTPEMISRRTCPPHDRRRALESVRDGTRLSTDAHRRNVTELSGYIRDFLHGALIKE